MNNPIITKKATQLAKSIVQRLWENGYWDYNEETYGLAKSAAIPVARMLMKEYRVYCHESLLTNPTRLQILKALQQAIYGLKYPKKQ